MDAIDGEGRWIFQSTHPVRGATAVDDLVLRVQLAISIHAPREGCDLISPTEYALAEHFNPRTP